MPRGIYKRTKEHLKILDKAREKSILVRKGKPSWNSCLTKKEYPKLSGGCKKGYKRSEGYKEKLRKFWNSPEQKVFAKERRAKQIFPIKDTSIEVKIQNFLKELGIEYYSHFWVNDIKNKYQCDIFIPVQNKIKQKMVIECDGNWWHGNPQIYPNPNKMQIRQIKEDNIRTSELIGNGFKVIRLWETEIKVMELNNFKEMIQNA